MILLNYASLGRVPGFIIGAGLVTPLVIGLLACVYTIRPPLAVVTGATQFLPAVKPLDISPEYVERFISLFMEKYATWTIYSYELNRNVALRMLSVPLAQTVLRETVQTEYLVRVFQGSSTIVLGKLDITRVSETEWVVKVPYSQTTFDAGVARDPVSKSMTMLMYRISPDINNPFCLEIVTLDDRQDEKANVAVPVAASPAASPTVVGTP